MLAEPDTLPDRRAVTDGAPMPLLRLWTKAEDKVLRREFKTESVKAIAADLGRTPQAVYGRAAALGIHRTGRKQPRWTDAENVAMRSLWGKVPARILATMLGRREETIYMRASNLGITRPKAPDGRTWETVADAARRHGRSKNFIATRLKKAGIPDHPLPKMMRRLDPKAVDAAIAAFPIYRSPQNCQTCGRPKKRSEGGAFCGTHRRRVRLYGDPLLAKRRDEQGRWVLVRDAGTETCSRRDGAAGLPRVAASGAPA